MDPTKMATDPIHNPLPGGVFRDESTYAEECERLVSGRWLSVTTGLVVPEPGDLFPCRLFGRSLLVARGKDGEVRVFYNLCRHRGAPLVDQPCRAVAGLVTCPYHAWSYRIDGSLFRAPYYHREREKTSPSEDERENLGLIPLRTAVWRDIIFVDFDGTAPEFDGFIAPIDNRLADWSAAELHPLGSPTKCQNASPQSHRSAAPASC